MCIAEGRSGGSKTTLRRPQFIVRTLIHVSSQVSHSMGCSENPWNIRVFLHYGKPPARQSTLSLISLESRIVSES